MTRHLASLLVPVAALALGACDSSRSPLAPAPIAQSAAASSPPMADAADSLTVAKPSAEDTVVIERGELDIDHLTGQISIEGNREFSLIATVSPQAGAVQAFISCAYSNCTPGTSIPLNATWSGSDLVAVVTLDGITYPVGTVSRPSSALVQFSGTVVAPALTKRGFDQVTAPFSMTGRLTSTEYGRSISETFTGEGVVKVWFARSSAGTGWSVTRLLYRFKHPNTGMDGAND